MGKRRLEKALETVRTTMGVEADVEWLPFFLNASLPKEGVDKMEHYNKKFGGESGGVWLVGAPSPAPRVLCGPIRWHGCDDACVPCGDSSATSQVDAA